MSGIEEKNGKYTGISLPIWGIAMGMMAVTLWVVFFQGAPVTSLPVVPRLGALYWASVVVVGAAFLLLMVFSAIYLVMHQRTWDRMAHAAAEIGMLFCTMALLTGPLWLQAGWQIWWRWDERFTTTCLIWLLSLTYLLIRKHIPGEIIRRFSAVLGMMIFWIALVVYLGGRWRQALHPTTLREEGWRVASVDFGAPLVICMCSFLIVFAYLFQHRVAVEAMHDDLEDVRQALLGQEQQMRDFRVENQDFIIEGYTFKEYKKNE